MDVISQMKKNKQPFTEEQLRSCICSLLDGFAFMDQKGIFHFDVKPHNIFVSKENFLKIADFNIAQVFKDESLDTMKTSNFQVQGTDGYMAPEVQIEFDKVKAGQRAKTQSLKA